MRLVNECMRNRNDIIDFNTTFFRETNKREKPQRAWSAQGEWNQQLHVHFCLTGTGVPDKVLDGFPWDL